MIYAIFYVLCTGYLWRDIPPDLPNRESDYTVFRRWRLDGNW